MRKKIFLFISITLFGLLSFWTTNWTDVCKDQVYCTSEEVRNSDDVHYTVYRTIDYCTNNSDEVYNIVHKWACDDSCIEIWWSIWNFESDENLQCCEWLTPVIPKWFNPEMPLLDSPSICIKKWDWVCDDKYEDSYNSPEDCKEQKVCTTDYTPVCWREKILCEMDWCWVNLPKTYSNMCKLENDNAMFLYNWECIEEWVKDKIDSIMLKLEDRIKSTDNTIEEKVWIIDNLIDKFNEFLNKTPKYSSIINYIINRLEEIISSLYGLE